MLTPKTKSLTYWPRDILHVTNWIIFCVACHIQESSGKYLERRVGSSEAETYDFGIKEPPECEERFFTRVGWSNQSGKSGVLARSRKLLRDTNRNPTMNCQKRQQGDAQSFSTWNRGGEMNLHTQPAPGNWAREVEITNSESRSFTFTTCRSPIIGTLRMSSRICGKRLNLAQDAPPIGIQALKTNVLIWDYVNNNERSRSHGTKLQW